jgi:nitrate reductase (NAD(P)H)
LELHPGEVNSILINAGTDATEDFVAIHSTKATKMLEKYYVGEHDKASLLFNPPKYLSSQELVDEKGNKLALNPKVKTILTLQNKIVLSHDSILLDFAQPSPQHILGLPTGKHMFFSAKIHGETVLPLHPYPRITMWDVSAMTWHQ